MTESKDAQQFLGSMSDVLGFAKGADAGQPIRIYSAAEFVFEGIRFNPGTYEVRKVITHPEAQGNKDLGEPDLRSLVEELLASAIAMRDDLIQRAKFGMADTVPVVACGNSVWMKFQDAIHSYQARSAAPTLLIKGESELESASNGMGLR